MSERELEDRIEALMDDPEFQGRLAKLVREEQGVFDRLAGSPPNRETGEEDGTMKGNRVTGKRVTPALPDEVIEVPLKERTMSNREERIEKAVDAVARSIDPYAFARAGDERYEHFRLDARKEARRRVEAAAPFLESSPAPNERDKPMKELKDVEAAKLYYEARDELAAAQRRFDMLETWRALDSLLKGAWGDMETKMGGAVVGVRKAHALLGELIQKESHDE